MANDVYLRTHDGLATMVSARAATRVLRDTLTAQGKNADTIDAALMGQLLIGPILQEFEQILPREGLKRNLEDLASSLHSLEGKASAPNPTSPTSPSAAANASLRHSRRPQASEAQDESLLEERPSPVSFGEATQSRINAASRTSSGRGRRREPLQCSQEQLEDVVLRFAQIEHVRLVAAIREKGDVAVSRGSGVDLESLSRYGLMGLRLLGRSGNLHSYYLAHSLGQLFLFTFGADTIIVLGAPELNVGTVFTTANTLKEEL